jgi:hypothetical protein
VVWAPLEDVIAGVAELHQSLLNLTFVLRGNPVVKGIIQ